MSLRPRTPQGSSGGLRQQHAARLKAELEAKRAQADAAEVGGPRPGQDYTLREGDTLESIARQVEQEPEAIWNHDNNEELRESRASPQELQAGDAIFIPAEEKDTGPVGQGDYVVKQGDSIASIAKDLGYFWETIWNEPTNRELREVRQDPNVLLPGDRVTLPKKTPKQESGETEERHRFVRRGEPAAFRLCVLRYGEPRANQPYTLDIDGQVYTGTTDADGKLQCPAPGNARRATVTVGEGDDQDDYVFSIGRMDPITTITGVQGRLNNLGFDCGPEDGHLGPRTRDAIRAFQGAHELEENGKLDDGTRQKLEAEYAS